MSSNQIERLLILDENESNVLFFEMLIQQLGRPIRVYTSGAAPQAEMIVRDERIQFIICAWEMNSMPGTVFVQRIRSDRNRKYLPCLIFSKRMKEQDITLTKELGFDNILGMPFDKKVATEMIIKMIEEEEQVTPNEKKLRKIEGLIAENKLTEALKMFEPSLTKKKEFRPRALTNLAEIWLCSAHLDKAERSIVDALATDPDYNPALRLQARIFSAAGRHAEAIAVLEKMIEKSPKNIKSLLSLGSAYANADQHDKAKEVFKKVEAIDGDNAELRDEQGKLAFKEGDLPLAAQLLAETQNGEEIARHINNMAIAHVAAGRFDEGISTYQQAIQILGDKARLHQLYYNLGLACKKKGDLGESFRKLCESYVLSPSFEKAYVALAKVAQEIKASGQAVNKDLVGQVREARTKFKGEGRGASHAS